MQTADLHSQRISDREKCRVRAGREEAFLDSPGAGDEWLGRDEAGVVCVVVAGVDPSSWRE